MKAKLRRFHSPDVYDLVQYKPSGSFGFLLQMMIGPEGALGEESFDTMVCSPEWAAENPSTPGLLSSHHIILDNYDYEELYKKIQLFCKSVEGDTWLELALQLSKIGTWEFENYTEYKRPRA